MCLSLEMFVRVMVHYVSLLLFSRIMFLSFLPGKCLREKQKIKEKRRRKIYTRKEIFWGSELKTKRENFVLFFLNFFLQHQNVNVIGLN